MNPTLANYGRPLTSAFIESEGEQLNNIEFIDVSSITTSNLVLFQSPFDGTEECDDLDLITGRIGEEMVYEYLLNKYSDQLNLVSIKWENQYRETHQPYDISLTKHGITHYIEVKSTRTYNQHIFPLSINQIETFLKHKENYFIYRVYIDEKKFIILDNIRWRLIQKRQLACLLRIIPIPLDQTVLTSD
ncbi:unnamed protein product [Rotaria sp. Silwood1]|nr:unnamed protein product [Rotaria sp. Silwood1]CAF1652420.1 unnamed protein product [Rotaria sp. Silwood1]CAF3840784.1 unnamed protein product [Rotaria sp. Silwood1]CAF3857678.1 unnamed protein product [Rotaria sp. Silwood1]CAF3881418.1 unnamed protein product [Rotaria sp. Silwood1]